MKTLPLRSVWLVPAGRLAESISRYIADAARHFHTPGFDPHMTLVGSLPCTEEDFPGLVERMRDAAAALPLTPLPLLPPATLDEEFRSLFLPVDAAQAAPVFSALSRFFPEVNSQHFRALPHVSLVYGMIPEAEKREYLARHPFPLEPFVPGELRIVETSAPVSGWRPEARVPLVSDG